MNQSIQKMRDFYSMKKDAPLYLEEFGYYSLDRWISEGHITRETDLTELFGFDRGGKCGLHGLGWCEAPFVPEFDVKVLEDRGEYELVQDSAGRGVLYFKGRRDGFMPEYEDHPVKDFATWERDVAWRLQPNSPERFSAVAAELKEAKVRAAAGEIISQYAVGGYMYLRSLMGPEGILYMVYDNPKLVHACMETWFAVSDTVIEAFQKEIVIDELFFAEDICYKNGPLISPDMMREFLFPYYQQLITNMKRRSLEPSRHLYFHVDTDGDCRPVIPVYRELGLDVMSPYEVASDCDVVEIRKAYPELRMRGGIDKRILAEGKDAIDRELTRIIPFMRAQGGYIPTSDHGVPEEVSFENYVYFRQRVKELGCD